MEILKTANLGDLSRDECDSILLALIPHLKKCPSKSGSEGTAYFVNDRYIVKKYNNEKKWVVLDDIFDAYCREIQMFGEKGYSVPKIYAWVKIPIKHHWLFESKSKESYYYTHDYYVLQEKAEGREIYLNKIDDIYEQVESMFKPNRFGRVLRSPEKFSEEYEDLLSVYIRDFIRVNSFVENMSESEIDAFVSSIYGMYLDGSFSTPDIHSNNVIFNGSHLTIIDNYMAKRFVRSSIIDYEVEEFDVYRVLLMLRTNKKAGLYCRQFDKIAESQLLHELVDENKILCTESAKKLFESIRRVLGGTLQNPRAISTANTQLISILGEANAQQITSILTK